MNRITLTLSLVLFLLSNLAMAQNDVGQPVPDTTDAWHHLDLAKSGVTGISLKEAIAFADSKKRKAQPIVVAVLDSGIDTAHYDLKDRLWVNKGEIPNNGIDDDGNGYIDDVHGWNFLGNQKGENVEADTWEITRQYRRLKQKYDGKKKKDIAAKDKAEFKEWLEIKDQFESLRVKYYRNYKTQKFYYTQYKEAAEHVKENLDKSMEFNMENVSNMITLEGSELEKSQSICASYLKAGHTVEDMKEIVDYFEIFVKKKLNPNYHTRQIVGDDVNNIQDSIYGNNNINAGDVSHGTHVAGIIGADAHNEVGTRGVCPTSEIMVLRVVPSGDERDKDVAMAYRYAAKMGAKIINCSFGKTYSPNKVMVDDAMKYVDQKGAIIIHAAGNDAVNNDKIIHYPIKTSADGSYIAKNWITVGSNKTNNDKHMLSGFSNYGKKEVDLFAPGSNILSTYPKSKIKKLSGTSMATPVVSGVAALVWSYYPELTADQLMEILLKSVVDYSDKKVIVPHEKGRAKKKRMRDLCTTGGVINALTAMQMADQMVNP